MTFENLTAQKTSRFYEEYETGRFLGDGNFSIVKECIELSTRIKHAVKIVALKGKRNAKEDLEDMMFAEVSMVQNLKHKNIIRCIDAFFGSSEILVVLEYTESGDLFSYVVNSGPVAENTAREFMKDIASSLQYLHSKQIVHRDVKPENFLLFKPSQACKTTVKLCDFGLAINASEELNEVCGSPSYVAPEVLNMDGYGLLVDVWSCGVVMYVMLCQFAPFYGNTNNKLFSSIISREYSFPEPYWDDKSALSKHLISKMLVEKERRITAEQILLHPWFDETTTSSHNESDVKKTGSHKCFKDVAVAVKCAQRLSEPIRKQEREQAVLSKTVIEQAKLKDE